MQGSLRLRGHVRGQLSVQVDADINGTLQGSFTGTVQTGASVQEEGVEQL